MTRGGQGQNRGHGWRVRVLLRREWRWGVRIVGAGLVAWTLVRWLMG